MPGGYAHISAVQHLLAGNTLEDLGLPKETMRAVTRYEEFCILGSVSPDYPYLVLAVPGHTAALEWANLMHKCRVGEFIKAGVRRIQDMQPGKNRDRCLAWLLGYVSHVGMDMTIHPIVEMIAGPYTTSENKRKHRVCEMHQDVHIWQRMGLGTVGRGDTIDRIRWCTSRGRLHYAVRRLWDGMLLVTHPDEYEENKPDIDQWHTMFPLIVDKVEESHKFPRFARHVACDAGVAYPTPDEVEEDRYIKKLQVPVGEPMDYGDIFDRAVENVGRLWAAISTAVIDVDNTQLAVFGNWSLDVGRDQDTDKFVMWA